MLSILTDADSVELKMSVPDADRRSAIAALGLDPLAADVVQIWFFDTVDLDLNASGVIARVRRTKARDDSTVKLRPVIPNDLPGKLRARSGFGVEIDAMPGGFVCSGRLKEKLKPGTVRKAMLGGKPPSKLFSKQQRAFFEQHAPPGLTLDDLEPLGPITALKQKFAAGRLRPRAWSQSCGCTRTGRASSSCPPSVSPRRHSSSPPRGGHSCSSTGSSRPACSRPRPRPRSSTSRASCGARRRTETPSIDDHRDVERSYSTADTVAKLRRLSDALEQEKPFRIQIAGERIKVPRARRVLDRARARLGQRGDRVPVQVDAGSRRGRVATTTR